MTAQKINWTNVGRGVAYVLMGFGSVCGIAAYKGEPQKNDYVKMEEFRRHESIDSVVSINREKQYNKIEQLLINMNGKLDNQNIDIAVLKTEIKQLNKIGH